MLVTAVTEVTTLSAAPPAHPGRPGGPGGRGTHAAGWLATQRGATFGPVTSCSRCQRGPGSHWGGRSEPVPKMVSLHPVRAVTRLRAEARSARALHLPIDAPARP
jgi:hypothetical protein